MLGYQTPDVDLKSLLHSINVDNIDSSDDEFSLSATPLRASEGAEIGVEEENITLENTVMQPDTLYRATKEYEIKPAGKNRNLTAVHYFDDIFIVTLAIVTDWYKNDCEVR